VDRYVATRAPGAVTLGGWAQAADFDSGKKGRGWAHVRVSFRRDEWVGGVRDVCESKR
jgi:hypothetical protein